MHSYIPEHQRMKALEQRLDDILKRDYYSMAKAILDRRMAGEEDGPVRRSFYNGENH
jgi:hypothetical protein